MFSSIALSNRSAHLIAGATNNAETLSTKCKPELFWKSKTNLNIYVSQRREEKKTETQTKNPGQFSTTAGCLIKIYATKRKWTLKNE